MGCGPSVPLDAAVLERALGRNPAGSNLFAQRAIEWRMKALLGRDYDAVLARFAASQPLARDGDVWFVLADPREGAHGASAILFDDARMDIVLADAEGTRRYSSGTQPLAAPQVVQPGGPERRAHLVLFAGDRPIAASRMRARCGSCRPRSRMWSSVLRM